MQEEIRPLKQVKLYNVIFPLWMLIMFPIPALPTILCVLGNGFIDAMVLHVGMKKQQVELRLRQKVITWLKVFVTGWTMDFLVALVLLIVSALLPHPVAHAIQMDAFSNPIGFLMVVCAIGMTASLIYLVNLKWNFRKLDWTIEQKQKVAFYLAVWTAPYLFLLPTVWFY